MFLDNLEIHQMIRLTPIKAIRKHCIECCGGSHKEVRECNRVDCHLYPYRMGINPRRKGIGENPTFKEKIANLN